MMATIAATSNAILPRLTNHRHLSSRSKNLFMNGKLYTSKSFPNKKSIYKVISDIIDVGSFNEETLSLSCTEAQQDLNFEVNDAGIDKNPILDNYNGDWGYFVDTILNDEDDKVLNTSDETKRRNIFQKEKKSTWSKILQNPEHFV